MHSIFVMQFSRKLFKNNFNCGHLRAQIQRNVFSNAFRAYVEKRSWP